MLKTFILTIFIATLIGCEGFGLNVMIQEAPQEQTTKRTTTEAPEGHQSNVLTADDLCAKLKCGPGEHCVFDDSTPICSCMEECDSNSDPRLMVCTSSNRTYESECHFYREKCWCNRQDQKCADLSVSQDTLDYYGLCQYIGTCTDEQKEVFPSRIKTWFDEVLTILNTRKEMDAKYGFLVSLAKQMKEDKIEKYWTCGVAFEFCQLDKSHDGIIEFEELKALISPIKSLENCIQPFLEQCDEDKNSKITDVEWGKCLDLSADDLELLRKACK